MAPLRGTAERGVRLQPPHLRIHDIERPTGKSSSEAAFDPCSLPFLTQEVGLSEV